ncbi:flagellar basal body rod protein FlgB [Conexibacter sp. SYSU D00693]|uniref:flagellar basal body rod protein FlgB n=1 Tax=Conexibacter sp. SYSU D00693 TaxID=2812560 RepID=UPI00196AA8D9|nr:flagellar basal body rod protein FlgB [Conexibacter sp. SYSU D00693]
MELFDTTHLGLERALAGAAARQSAIAGNLANVSTPGYRRQDLDFHGVLRNAFAEGGKDALERADLTPSADPLAPMRLDGNSVDADVEAAEQARNGLEYEALASVIKARDDVLRAAIGVA